MLSGLIIGTVMAFIGVLQPLTPSLVTETYVYIRTDTGNATGNRGSRYAVWDRALGTPYVYVYIRA